VIIIKTIEKNTKTWKFIIKLKTAAAVLKHSIAANGITLQLSYHHVHAFLIDINYLTLSMECHT